MLVNRRNLTLRRLWMALALLLLATGIGTIGFMLIEGYSFVEAFYMTVITVSTVGFKEVRDLSQSGQIFTSFLIIANIGIFTYAISLIASYVIEGEFKDIVKNLRMQRKIEAMESHTIVCGYGRNGKEACEELELNGERFVVIEMEPEKLKTFEEKSSNLYVEGDATQDDILDKAGIKRAKALITCLPKDADNVFVTLTAREMNPRLQIISRASDESAESKLIRAGANHIIMPEKIGGSHMANMVTRPDIVEFFNLLTDQGGVSISFHEIDFAKAGEKLKGTTIGQLDIRRKTGANIIGLRDINGNYIVNPSPETVIDENIRLIVLGNEQQIEAFRDLIRKGEL